jgi:hypothetical protein
MMLDVTKLALAQNNFHAGPLNKKAIVTLSIQPAKAQVNTEKEILTRRRGDLFK